jgi:putative redox protein
VKWSKEAIKMATEVKVDVVLQEKIQLKGKGHTPHEVLIDYIPPLGNDDGFMPMELLLVSLAGCSGHTVMFILKNMKKSVEGLEVKAVGNRREEHPTVFTEIQLHFYLKGETLDAASVERAITVSEKEYCPVWAMLKNNVCISWKYTLN